MTYPGDRLSDFPWVVVRLACEYCPRKGSYRLARLAAKHGAEIGTRELLLRLSADCEFQKPLRATPPGKVGCGAYYVDLEGSRPPPDMPPAMMGLRVIAGGKG